MTNESRFMCTLLYNFLVNRHQGISHRYHRLHDNSIGIKKTLSWLYLLWLNIAYYVFFCRFLGRIPRVDDRDKKLLIHTSESQNHVKENPHLTAESFIETAKGYDVISFDVFDTLIFRPVAQPVDVFYFVGERLAFSDFRSLRMLCEHTAREKSLKKYGHSEVSLSQIYDELSEMTGLSKEEGMRAEIDAELSLCFANDFMSEVWRALMQGKKHIIITSDMYMSKDVIKAILEKNGFSGADEIYVSCEVQKNKAGGALYDEIKNKYLNHSILHIGDNRKSDIENAKKAGIDALYYPNTNICENVYRPKDMSFLAGSAYRGLVARHIYNAAGVYSMEYEYGFIYGGLFAVGYCHFVHDYVKLHNIERLFFLSRDGDILKRVYEMLFFDEKERLRYVYWSRKAAVKLMAKHDKHDYFRRFIFHKTGQGYTIENVLEAMDLSDFKERISDEDICLSDVLTQKNAKLLKSAVEANWKDIIKHYDRQSDVARDYYKRQTDAAKSIAAVDVGWAGSGALSLSYLMCNEWNMDVELVGIIAGTNTRHNAEADATESFIQSGKLAAYLYSSRHNERLYKLHNPAKDYNVWWELLLASPTRQFNGFDPKAKGGLVFGEYDANVKGIKEIQRGILDFAALYKKCFEKYPYMLNISGQDAYAPMVAASSCNERYLKVIRDRFALKKNID